MAEYIPSPVDWVRKQVELYESSGGKEGITLSDTGLESIPFLVEILTCPSRPHWPTFVVDRRHS